jgi:hypothetical protein
MTDMNWVEVVDGGQRPPLFKTVLVFCLSNLGRGHMETAYYSAPTYEWINSETHRPVDGKILKYAEIAL